MTKQKKTPRTNVRGTLWEKRGTEWGWMENGAWHRAPAGFGELLDIIHSNHQADWKMHNSMEVMAAVRDKALAENRRLKARLTASEKENAELRSSMAELEGKYQAMANMLTELQDDLKEAGELRERVRESITSIVAARRLIEDGEIGDSLYEIEAALESLEETTK